MLDGEFENVSVWRLGTKLRCNAIVVPAKRGRETV